MSRESIIIQISFICSLISCFLFLFLNDWNCYRFIPIVWWSVSWWKKIRDVSDCLTDPRLRFHRCSLPSLWWVHDWCVRKEKERLTAAINRFTPLDSPLVNDFYSYLHSSFIWAVFISCFLFNGHLFWTSCLSVTRICPRIPTFQDYCLCLTFIKL